jgi:hypothetical protein
MKYYNKTLLDLQYKVELSKTGACAACYASEFHGTKEWARQAVTKHRAISKDVRRSIQELLRQLDYYDSDVERYFAEMFI